MINPFILFSTGMGGGVHLLPLTLLISQNNYKTEEKKKQFTFFLELISELSQYLQNKTNSESLKIIVKVNINVFER